MIRDSQKNCYRRYSIYNDVQYSDRFIILRVEEYLNQFMQSTRKRRFLDKELIVNALRNSENEDGGCKCTPFAAPMIMGTGLPLIRWILRLICTSSDFKY
ncbi:uncharacterized protein LOC111037065 isoform X2 [Myzus persicae]|uniref:uncharacterized protein LOC111037065 isoform X2 n=1 Tax=Myzus persicae TaxID=13164 RepID=UPI000B93249A|nr:uncharacterized protein LOC111037065 isoform X2 [Myzus persicae]XP_022175120.1 uncharacterized protein LOC111037065 isoform X2 [Myzus persicae]